MYDRGYLVFGDEYHVRPGVVVCEHVCSLSLGYPGSYWLVAVSPPLPLRPDAPRTVHRAVLSGRYDARPRVGSRSWIVNVSAPKDEAIPPAEIQLLSWGILYKWRWMANRAARRAAQQPTIEDVVTGRWRG